jgi:hypothetical protein
VAQGRLDVPAAGRTRGPVITSGLPQLLDELQHRGRTCQLRERLSLRNVSGLIAQSVLCVLLGRESRSLINIMCTQCRICKHRNLGGLYLEGTTADEEVLLLAVGSLHAYFARLEQGQERSMTGRYTQVPISAWRKEHFGLAGENLAFGADDVDVNGVIYGHVVLLQGLRLGDCLFDRADHVEGLLRQRVELPAEDTLEAADGVLERDNLAILPGEHLCDVEWL